MALRPAQKTESDARLLMLWRNDPITREMSFHQEEKLWDSYWPEYQSKIDFSSGLGAYFLTDEEEYCAFIHFEAKSNNSFEISIVVNPQQRGKGYGTRALMAAQHLASETRARELTAYVKLENLASLKIFERAGFSEIGEELKHISDIKKDYRVKKFRSSLKKGALFDFDGTLVDSLPHLKKIFFKVFSNATEADFKKFNGMKISEFLPIACSQFGSAASTEEIQDTYKNEIKAVYSQLDIRDEASKLISQLAEKSFVIAVVSSGPLELIQTVVSKSPSSKNIEYIVSAETPGNSKPSPDPYLYACKQLDLNPALSYAFEDSQAGKRSAESAGLYCFEIRNETDFTNILEKMKAHETY